jgi:hypothetical protein
MDYDIGIDSDLLRLNHRHAERSFYSRSFGSQKPLLVRALFNFRILSKLSPYLSRHRIGFLMFSGKYYLTIFREHGFILPFLATLNRDLIDKLFAL